MENNIIRSNIKFIKYNGKYRFQMGQEYYYLNGESLLALKSKTRYPMKILFLGFYEPQIKLVLKNFLDDNTEYELNSIKRNKKAFDCEIIIKEKRHTINVCKINSISMMYQIGEDIHTYNYVKIGDKSILMEVTKDYIKNNKGIYYYKIDDLDEFTKSYFNKYITTINCDYIYNLQKGETIDFCFKKR